MYSNNNAPGAQLPQLNLQAHSEKQPFDDGQSRKRTKKDRACDLCRRKKIRCDYDSAYPQNSCSSCKSYQKSCTFNEAAKKRGPPKGYVEGLENRLKRMEQLLMNIAANGNLPAETVKAVMEGNDEDSETDSHSDDNVKGTTSIPEPIKDADQSLKCYAPTDMAAEESKEPYSYVGSSSGIYLLSRLFTNNMTNTSEQSALPRPLEGHEEDLMIARFGRDRLNKLGVERILNPDWKLPPKELTDHLIKMYFQHLNHLLPVLDKDLFYEEYHKANPAPNFVPIIMSVCRISCRLLNDDDPIMQKYNEDPSSLFHDLSKQIQMYFHLDFLEPKIEAIQVLLLNAMNATEWGLESKDWIAVSVAVKMAQDLGLHRANTQQEGVLKREAEAKKRLWWSVYVSDRWFSCVMDRPLAIGDSDCNVDLPSIQDETEDYTIFINFIKLSSIFGEIFRRIYTPKAKKNGYKTKAMEQTLWSLEKFLEEWFANVPEKYKISDKDLEDIKANPQLYKGTKKLEEGGPMTICYHAIVVLLHRPFMDLEDVNREEMPCLAKSTEVCTNAAKMAIDVARAVPAKSVARFGWNFAAHSVFEAALIHVYNSSNKDPSISKTAKEYIHIAVTESLEPLATSIPAAPPLHQYLQIMFMLMEDQEKLNKSKKLKSQQS